MDVLERTLPHSLEAERSVLGAIILRNDAFEEAAEHIGDVDFYRDAHRRIFGKMGTLRERKSAIDLITLKEALGSDLESIGGPAYVSRLVDGVPRSTNVPHYARIVREKSVLRSLIVKAGEVLDNAYCVDAVADDVLQAAEASVFQLAQAETRGDLVPASALIPGLLTTIQRFAEGQGNLSGLATGFVDIDRFTCGLQPADLIVVGGRSSMGKSTWAQDVARHVACKLGEPVAFFSPETSKEEFMLRQVIAMAGADGHRVRSGYLHQADYTNLTNALGKLDTAPLHIDDTPGIRPMEIRSKCRRMKALHGLSLIIIDYIQLMHADRGTRFENRQTEMTAVSQSVKAVAKDLRVPVIALAQLRRKPDESAENRPSVADLRESGSFENDADIVGLLHRPGKYEPDNEKYFGIAEFILAKQRHGPTGIVTLAWNESATRFGNYVETPYA
jgi:replicative DNA helicase